MAASGSQREGRSWDGVSVAAERYERDLVPALFEPWAEVIVDIAEVRPGDRVVDLACGTGVIVRAAAARVGPDGFACGVDVNGDMLALARQAAPEIEWRQAEASETGLPDASFDVGFCHQGLQFFADPLAGLREFDRVLVRGGRAVIATWCADDGGDTGYTPIAGALRRHHPSDSRCLEFIEAIFALSDGTELARLVEAAGFGDVAVERRTGIVRFPSAEAWVDSFLAAAPGPAVSGLTPATRAAVIADAAADLRPHVDAVGVAFPLHTNIVRGRA